MLLGLSIIAAFVIPWSFSTLPSPDLSYDLTIHVARIGYPPLSLPQMAIAMWIILILLEVTSAYVRDKIKIRVNIWKDHILYTPPKKAVYPSTGMALDPI